MKAPPPPPRTDEQRASVVAHYARLRDGLDYRVGDELLEIVRHVRPRLDSAKPRVMESVAKVYIASTMPARRHKVHAGCFSMHSRELEGCFGRGKFKKLAATHRIASVAHKWGLGSTDAWMLHVEFAELMGAEIARRNRPQEPPQPSAVREGVRESVLRWSARHDLQGLSRELIGAATLTPFVPVDIAAMNRLYDRLADLQRSGDQDRAAGLASLNLDRDADLSYLRELVGMLVQRARTDESGYGGITHRYVMKKTGRLFAKWPGLQGVPKVVKRTALDGAYVYDWENCHYTIMLQLAARAGQSCPAISHYIDHKDEVRSELGRAVGVSIDQIKTCLIALGYGASDSEWHEASIPETIGRERARVLYAQPLFRDLYDELERVRPCLLEPYVTRKGVLRNAVGLAFDEEDAKKQGGRMGPKQQAHVLQGIEVKALLCVLRRYAPDILLLEHDGFVSRHFIEPSEINALVEAETGFKLKLKCEVNSIPL